MPAMAAFIDQSFSSTVLEGASRQKNTHDGLEEQHQTISCSSESMKFLKFKLWKLRKSLGFPKIPLSIM